MKNIFKKDGAEKKGTKKLRNKALFKRGGYALAITAVVVAGILVLNILVSALSSRFHLSFDLSAAKQNSVSAENLEYIKGIDKDVNITLLATQDGYTGGYMEQYANYLYNASDATGEYYAQTVRLLEQYDSYSESITLNYVDPQDPEFSKIKSDYPTESFTYGDILVDASFTGSAGNVISRHKVLTFSDIYELTDSSGMASYGYDTYTVGGSNLETKLTSAIASVMTEDTKKIVLLSSHSSTEAFSYLQENLELNNFEIESVDGVLTELPEDTDAVAVVAPTVDLTGSELDVISRYLNNNGKLGGSFLYFADSSCPSLPNLQEFLQEWGIIQQTGVLFETNSSYRSPNDPTIMYMLPVENDVFNINKYFVGGSNVPFTIAETIDKKRTVDTLASTSSTVAVAPVGAPADWSGANDAEKSTRPVILMSTYSDVVDNEEVSSYVFAFSGVSMISEEWAKETGLANLSASISVVNKATGMAENGVTFKKKTITSESFASSVNQTGSTIINIVFAYAIPLLLVAAAIVVFIRRKNK